MIFSLEDITRPNIAALKPYRSARSQFIGEAVLLDANENPFGDGENRYPDPMQSRLRSALAQRAKLNPGQVLLGNGSDELIDLLVRAFCEPGTDTIVTCPPTFSMYGVVAAVNNVDVKNVPLKEGYQLDTDVLVKTHANILFLTCPNSPTGTIYACEEIETILDGFSGLVVIDEAYVDFSDTPGWAGRLSAYPNLVILQTFSKYWGLAGCRVGMMYADAGIIRTLAKIKMPYNVNTLSAERALAAVRDEDNVRKQADILLEQRARLATELAAFPFVRKVYPSQANFLWIEIDKSDRVRTFLEKKGIIVRDFSNHPQHLRMTVGTPGENVKLLAVLSEYVP